MSEHISVCSDELLWDLLKSDDGGEELRESATHVEQCPRCQLRLEQLAAEPREWHIAKESLSGGDADGAEADTANEERPWSRHGSRNATVLTDSMARQLLSPPSHPEMLGRIGRYEVERLIGSGGMGVVFKAFDTELNRPVAVKVLAPYLAGSGAARKRFAREARAAAAVVHEHVVAIHNVETDGTAPFLVMPYVAGESLQQRIDRDGPLELCEILRIGMQTASGLAAAHAQGLVHRDVKPSNILLEQSVERALLTDFGLARASDDASLTHTGYHPGTPQYMSPEQARGESVDARSDLFSLGSVLYTMATGRPPFRAETSYGILRRITDTEPRPIREVSPDVPDWLCEIIAKLMAKQADDRFALADEVAELLEDCLAHVQQPTTMMLPESVEQLVQSLPAAQDECQPDRTSSPLSREPSASALRLILPAAFVVAMVFAGVLIAIEMDKGQLKIHSAADGIPIRIMHGDEAIRKLTVTRSGASVRIAAGQYAVEIDGELDGITVAGGNVSLKRRGVAVVNIVETPVADAINRKLAELPATVHHDFATDGFPGDRFAVGSEGGSKHVVETSDGIHVRNPGRDGFSSSSIETQLRVHGNFEITATFENASFEPGERGSSGISLTAILENRGYTHCTVHRGAQVGHDNTVWHFVQSEFLHSPDREPGLVWLGTTPEEATAGRLRLSRVGETVYCLFAPNDSPEFRLIHTENVGKESMLVGGVRLEAAVQSNGSTPGTTSVLWNDLTIRAERITDWAGVVSSGRETAGKPDDK